MSSKKNKKTKLNGFVVFCKEKENTLPQFRGLQMSELCTNREISEMWQSLTLNERQVYVQMAKEIGEGYIAPIKDGNVTGRFDCLGNSLLAQKQREEMEKCKNELCIFD